MTKNLKVIFSRTDGLIVLKLDIWHQVTKYYQVYMNDDFVYIFDKVKLGPLGFWMGWERGMVKQCIFQKLVKIIWK